MSRWLKLIKQSIMRRLVAIMAIFLSLALLGALVVSMLNESALKRFTEVTNELKLKQDAINAISDHTEQIFFRARGYYAFQFKSEYDLIFKEKLLLEQSIENFKRLPLTDSEQELARLVEDFFDQYFKVTLPMAVEYVEQNDYDALSKFSANGLNLTENELVIYADRFSEESDARLKSESDRLSNQMASQAIILFIYIAGVLIMAIVVMKRLAKDIGIPIRALTLNAGRFARGESVEMGYLSRNDEIGQLWRSFDYMMVQIQSKEEVLLSQNEELQAQQDELQMQQEELQEAMNKMEDNELYLMKRNKFIQSLTNTLDKSELLHSIVRNMTEMMKAEKGIIVLINTERNFASFGISEQAAKQCVEQMEHGPLARVMETKTSYIIERHSYAYEQSYHAEDLFSFDLYVPIQSEHGIIACMILTRTGKAFARNEELEVFGLAKQVGLSLEKLQMYEATEDERRLRQDMLNTIHEGVQLMNTLGETVHMNNMMCEMMDFPELKNGALLTLDQYNAEMSKRLHEPGQFVQFMRNIASGKNTEAGSLIYEMSYPFKRFVQVYSEPLYQGQERFGTVLVHRDITREYEVDQMKSEFVSTVSHELRTPLASVLGFTELLLYKELKPERQQKYLTTIHQEAKRLTALINDFLDLQRMEFGRQTYDMKPTEVMALIRKAIQIYQVNSQLHRFVVEDGDKPAWIMGDADKIMQIWMNLISNAVKYSPEGGTITIACKSKGEYYQFSIQDKGLGIPEASLPKLFQRFYRVDNSDRREIGGTGLGLAITKQIVEAHHGSIQVESCYGEGSTFIITFPKVIAAMDLVAADTAEPDISHDPVRIQGMKVLILEDDLHLSELLKEELEGSGFQVHIYTEGEEALQGMSLIQPDAVVIDIVLGDSIDGWSVIEQMKRDERLAHIPIIVSSAFEEKERGARLGAKGYLMKPYHPNLLSRTILQTVCSKERKGQILIPDSGMDEA